MNIKTLKYTIVELFKQKGLMWFIWRGLAIFILLWLFFPSFEPSKIESADNKSVVKQDKVSEKFINAPSTDRDLRKILTTSQNTYYWNSFNWVMEYGKPNDSTSFESSIIDMIFVAGDVFIPEGTKRSCRSFREKIILLGKSNERVGLACKRDIADWCKKIEGEKLDCRDKKAKGIDAITNSLFDTHNLNVEIQRNLYKLPNF